MGEFETSFIDSQQNKPLVSFRDIVDSAQGLGTRLSIYEV